MIATTEPVTTSDDQITLAPGDHPFAGAVILDPDRDLLLASLRALTAQYRLFAQQLDSIGIALKAGKITPATAIEWLDELGMKECLPMLGILDSERPE